MADQDSLEHYGIKGMKWGVRRSRDELARLRGEKTPPSQDAVKARDLQKRVKRSGTKSLSNKQLKDLNARLELEKSYKRLTTKDKKKKENVMLTKGEKAALKSMGLTLAGAGIGMWAASKQARQGARWVYNAYNDYNPSGSYKPAATSVVRKAIDR